MAHIIIATLLMSFLLWSYNLLNKNFTHVEKNVPNTNAGYNYKELFSTKRLFATILLFLGCYTFIAYSMNEGKTEIIEEARHEVLQQQTKDAELESSEANKTNHNEQNKAIKILKPNQINTKFSDVAGLHEAKDEVQDIISFLQDPTKFGRLGAKSPKGVLLYGEPGTGKTMMARAIAGEAQVAFIAVAGAEFDEEFVGVGAARVRQLFELARQNSPCIIFIDEIDALAHKRNAHDPAWAAQTVNQLLAEMDGLDSSKNAGIVVIGATNRLNVIEPAILRPGRLDRHIKLETPTVDERAQILELYLRKVKVNPQIHAMTIAKMTPGFSGAELANLVNEAAITATKANKKQIELVDFDAAKDRIVIGSKRQALKVSAQTRKITAFHEAGHTLVGHLMGNKIQPLYKVTIMPRGPSLGHTSFEPKADQTSINLQELEALICMQLAGRVAEELVFGERSITTGAESDLRSATELAHNMVTRWGYSKRIGLIYSKNHDIVPQSVIEQEIQKIIQNCYLKTKELLLNNRDQLDKLATALLEKETLDAKEIKQILSNHAANSV